MSVLLAGGFFRSLQFTSLATIAYADVDPRRVSRATPLVTSVSQQLSAAAGVAIGAFAVEITTYIRKQHMARHRRRLPPAPSSSIGLISALVRYSASPRRRGIGEAGAEPGESAIPTAVN